MQTTFKFLVLCLFCLTLSLVSGCGDANNPSSLVGTWEIEGVPVLVLRKDGTGTLSVGKITWKTEGSRLHITCAEAGGTMIGDYKISGSTLTITSDDGERETFIRSVKAFAVDQALVGTWDSSNKNSPMILRQDGTANVDNEEAMWWVENRQLYILGGGPLEFFGYEISGNTLTLDFRNSGNKDRLIRR